MKHYGLLELYDLHGHVFISVNMLMNTTYLAGHILVAPPKMLDRRFSNTVIYIASHTEVGAWGLVLNKSNNINARDILLRVGVDLSIIGTVYHGGPMNSGSIHFLHTDDLLSNDSHVGGTGMAVSGDMSYISLMEQGLLPNQQRVFMGLCSWAPGQLEAEILGQHPWPSECSWLTAPATEDIIFGVEGMDQWHEAVNHCAKATVKDWMC
jgi:putative transcriptional regulator